MKKSLLILALLSWAAPALAQYATSSTHLFPVSASSAPKKKTQPKNPVTSRAFQPENSQSVARKPDQFYPMKKKPAPVSTPSRHTGSKPVTVWKAGKKMNYPSLYQDPKN